MRKLLFYLLLFLPTAMLSAQDLIIPKQGDPITAYELSVGEKYIFYAMGQSADDQTGRIAIKDVLIVRKADGTTLNLAGTDIQPVQPAVAVVRDTFPIVDWTEFHGFIFQQGNNVYVPIDSEVDYIKEARIRLKELMIQDGFWNVVDDINQAHIVLYAWYCTWGRDELVIVCHRSDCFETNKTSWGAAVTDPCVLFYHGYTDETIGSTKRNVENFIYSNWPTWKNTLADKNSVSRHSHLKRFIIK